MSLNAREQAIAVWLLVILVWMMTKPDIRASFGQIMESFLSPIIFLPLLTMFAYIAGGVWLLAKINLWHWTNLKDTLIWTIVAIFALYLHSNEIPSEHGFFRTKVIENLKLTAIIEFIVNFHTFPFLIEFVLMPFLIVVGFGVVFTKGKDEYHDVKKFFEWVLAIVGLGIFAATVGYLWLNWPKVATLQTLLNFLLPFLLTVMTLPFIYCLALLIEYETVFTRIDIFTPDKSVSRYAKREIIRACHIHLYRLHRLSKTIGLPQFRDYDDIKNQIQQLNTAH